MSAMNIQRDFARPARVIRLALAVAAAVALAACQEQASLENARAYYPIPDAALALMASKGTTASAPILIRAFKKEAELEIWKMKPDGRYIHLKTFPVCRWSGQLGPKTQEGDRQVPEGFYSITPGQMNPNSHYYLSFNVGYPNAFDQAHGYTGGNIMVHGICSSAGCFAMTDKEIAEIYAIAREAFAGGQREIQMQSYPFHMTAKNLAKFRLDPNMPFWKELKKGSDYFKVTRQEPQVGVCDRRYVFDATPVNGERLDPVSPCPALKRDPVVAAAVAQQERQDDAQIAALIQKGVRPVRLVYEDGGQNQVFASKNEPDVSRPDALAQGPIVIAIDEKPAPTSVKIANAASSPNKAVRPAISQIEKTVAKAPGSQVAPTMVAASSNAGGAPFYSRWLGFVSEKLGGTAQSAQAQ